MAKNYVDNLSEEVKKGLTEKAAQGHFPGVAHVGYVNNRQTRRIEVDPVRGPLVSRAFQLYASGEFPLTDLRKKAFEIGLRHPRGDRRMSKSEIHRMLKNPVYTGDFLWLGKRRKGSHEPLVTHEAFDQVQAEKPRPRGAKQRHPFMGLLTCARCRCAMTAEIKKQKYVYYRCTGHRGACGDTYMRQERLAELLGDVVRQIQIPEELADRIAEQLRAGQTDLEDARKKSIEQVTQRQRVVQSKLDRGYEDYLESKISAEFWQRKSQVWEEELGMINAELERVNRPTEGYAVTGARILELAKNAHASYVSQDPTQQRKLLETVLSNCSFDRGTLCPAYSKPFDLFAKSAETENWRREWQSNAHPAGSRSGHRPNVFRPELSDSYRSRP